MNNPATPARQSKRHMAELIAFLFKTKAGNFHTTFAYTKSTDTWQWLMDDEESGKVVPFARVKLVRK